MVPSPGSRPEPARDPVVIVAARRTPIGRFLGRLRSLTAVDLGVEAVRGALRDLGGDGAVEGLADQVIFGCARQAGVGPNPARQIAVRAGLGDATVAHTVNMACGSGLEAVLQAARLVQSGEAGVVIAGGTEAMSRIPFLLERFREGYRMGHAEAVDAMFRDGYLCPLAEQLMGETAETLARQYGITRAEQDAYALESHRRANWARKSGRFDEEIVAVPVGAAARRPTAGGAGKTRGPGEAATATPMTEDENPRTGATLEGLAALPAVFASGGTITAGNASAITDGAAALVLTLASAAARRGWTPLVRLTRWNSAAVDPRVMGISPVPAVRGLLEASGLSLESIDRVELNEAFAAQVLAVDRELHLGRDRTNVNGGAIALGHPTGCTGARIAVTLIHEMRRSGARTGIATLCVSGGLGLAALFERDGG